MKENNKKQELEDLKKENSLYKNTLNYLQELENICGSSIIYRILSEYKEDLEELNLHLARYLQKLFLDLSAVENAPTFTFAQIDKYIINLKEIQRIEQIEELNIKKHKKEYILKIFKKYPTPEEEYYFLKFDSEEERQKNLDVLRAKLKQLGLNIL